MGATQVLVGSVEVRTGSMWRRIVSHTFDVVALGMLQSVIVLAALWPALSELFDQLTGISNADGLAQQIGASVELAVAFLEQQWAALAVAVFVAWVLGGIYEVLTTRWLGGTFGKQLTGLLVVDGDTLGRLSWRNCLIRWGGPAVVSGAAPAFAAAQLLTVVGYSLAAFDARRRAAHDLAAGALVIERSSVRTQRAVT